MNYYSLCLIALASTSMCNAMTLSKIDSDERALSFTVEHTKITVDNKPTLCNDTKFIEVLEEIVTALEGQHNYFKEEFDKAANSKPTYQFYEKAIQLCAAKMTLIQDDFLGKLSDFPISLVLKNNKNKESARELFINAVTLITKFQTLQKKLCKQCQSQHSTTPEIDEIAGDYQETLQRYANELSLSVSVNQVISID